MNGQSTINLELTSQFERVAEVHKRNPMFASLWEKATCRSCRERNLDEIFALRYGVHARAMESACFHV
jgi:hypothetical protein